MRTRIAERLFATRRLVVAVATAVGVVGVSVHMAVSQDAFEEAPAADQSQASQPASHAQHAQEAGHETVISHDTQDVIDVAVYKAHAACFKDDLFPSAEECGKCHPKHFEEWSASPHAYAQMSPVFNAFQNAENQLLHGTIGDFCIRCHTPVGMALNEPRGGSNLDRHQTSREGITCVVCHRVDQPNGRISGRMSLVAGDNHQVVFGPTGSPVLADVLANPNKYGVLKTRPNPEVRGRDIHSDAIRFFQITTSGFCGTCHDVLFPLGFRLEDAFSEFKASPAAREQHLSCQDCHMGKEEGVPSGYHYEPVAKIGNATTPPRKRTSHYFAGPDHSVVHPGIFPHNPKAQREPGDPKWKGGLATLEEWLKFDWQAGWGTEEFENNVPEDYKFPEPWQDQSRRKRARRILHEQFALLTEYKQKRVEVLRNGFGLGQIEGKRCDEEGLHFKVKVKNLTSGHGVPTGFDAERPFYVQVGVWDRYGQPVFKSGDLDPNGDYRDDHSFYVHNGEVPRDRQLFSLQSKFLTRNIRGNEREQILPIPYSLNPLTFDRPATRATTVNGNPLGARKHKQVIPPCSHRYAKYHVPAENLTGCGPYYVSVRLMGGMIPVNLVKQIEFAGFDYGMNAQQVAERVLKGHVVIRETSGVFHVHE